MKTQHQTIINVMNDNIGKWFLPMAFMQSGSTAFVGYEASARLSELARMYPNHMETQQQGKYKARRLIKQIDTNKLSGDELVRAIWATPIPKTPTVTVVKEAIIAAGGTYAQPSLFDVAPQKTGDKSWPS